MPKTHMINTGGTIRPQGELYPPTVIQGSPRPPQDRPKPPRWRKTLADWVAKPLAGHLVRELAGRAKNLRISFMIRRCCTRAGAST